VVTDNPNTLAMALSDMLDDSLNTFFSR